MRSCAPGDGRFMSLFQVRELEGADAREDLTALQRHADDLAKLGRSRPVRSAMPPRAGVGRPHHR